MAEVQVQASVDTLPPAKKGRFAGKKRHDALTIRPVNEGGQTVALDTLPEYVQEKLTAGKKVVIYKRSGEQSAYQVSLRALGLPNPYDVQENVQVEEELELEVASTPEDVQVEAEVRNERINAIMKSNLPRSVKDDLIASLSV